MKKSYLILILLILPAFIGCVPDKSYRGMEAENSEIKDQEPAPIQSPISTNNAKPEYTPLKTQSPTSETDSQSGMVYIEIKDMQFVPRELTIPSNTTVIWVNKDWSGFYGRVHLIVSATNKFRSQRILYNGTFGYTFTEHGTYKYIDPTYKSNTFGGIIIKPGIIYVV